MPRAFTEKEREAIKERIKRSGEELFRRYGFQKTTVADLAGVASISKGAFYLFFRSKEDLMMELIDDYEQAMRLEMVAEFERGPTGRDALQRILTAQSKRVRDEPLIRDLMTGDLIRQLWRGASEKSRARSVQGDEAFLQLLSDSYINLAVPAETAAGMLRALVLMSTQREQIGEAAADAAIEETITAVVNHIVADGPKR